MSKLYIDITKDRVYVEKSDSHARRSAQTAMYTILSSLTRMIAPMLAYTSEEIWGCMRHRTVDDTRSVLLNDMPSYDEALDFGDIETHWNRLFDIRDDVLNALETARAGKVIGKSLEAKIKITTSDNEIYALLCSFGEDILATVFIVSAVETVKSDGAGRINVAVSPADGEKCDRCWIHSTDGEKTEDGYICARCLEIIKG
jgi:isoleucyl-tRNA synthetase